MNGKVCLITGANAGLGKAISRQLAQLGATVVLGCRDRARGEAARDEIRSATSNANVEILLVDLSSQASVRRAVEEFKSRYDRLDVLINNAAVFKNNRTETPDGQELMFATNHLGPFLLTNLLLDVLKASAPSRIINISAPGKAVINFDDLQSRSNFKPIPALYVSKLSNVLFTYDLARRLQGTGVTVNVAYPGFVKSELMKEGPWIVGVMSKLFAISPEKAAEGPVYLATSPEVANVTGKFFKGKKMIDSSDYSKDPNVQQQLWDASARIVQLA